MKNIISVTFFFFFVYYFFAQEAPNFGWPVRTDQPVNLFNKGRITGTPGEHREPYDGGSAKILGTEISGERYHQGVDITKMGGADHGDEIYSIEPTGSTIDIEHFSSGNSRLVINNMVYWHVDVLSDLINEGDSIEINQVIGTINMGATGLAAHLHYQPTPSIIKDGPLNILKNRLRDYIDNGSPEFAKNNGESVIEIYRNGHKKEGNKLSTLLNTRKLIQGKNYTLTFGNIDLVIGVLERWVGVNGNPENNGHLGINKISFNILNEENKSVTNGFIENIDFTTLPNYESAGIVFGYFANLSRPRYVVTSHTKIKPYDRYFNTKLKKSEVENWNEAENSKNAKINIYSSISDGLYNINLKIEDLDTDEPNITSDNKNILIDNFLPYIKKVTLSNSEGVFYEGEWTLNRLETALEFDQCTFRNGISTGFNIKVETSETMNNLSMNLAGVSDSLIPTNNKNTVWELQNPFTGNASANQTITFTGNDMAGNLLLTDPSNLYYRVSDISWDSYTPNSPTTPSMGSDTIHKINMSSNCSDSCTDNYEPNNIQSQATLLSSFGKEFSTYGNIEACLSYNNIYEDWYLVGSTAQGKLNITLTEQTDDFIIELYSQGSSKPFAEGALQSNGNVTLAWCSTGNACVPLYIRVFKEQFSTPSSNPNYNYNLLLDWNYNESCSNSARQANINYNQNSTLTISGNIDVCIGEATTLSANGGSGNYQWFLNGNEIGTGISITLNNLNAGSNTVNVVDLDSACNSGSTHINVTQGITANAGQDQTILNGQSTQLQGSGGSTYSWSPTTGLSNPNIWNPIASPTQTTTYTLTVTENGCTDTDTVTVIVNNGTGGSDEPDNDNCNDAQTLTSNTNCSYTYGTIDHATLDGFPNTSSCDAHSNPNAFGVFYSFTAVSNTHTISVNPTGELDAVLTVYSGNSCIGLSEFDCDDTSGVGSASITNNNFVMGQQYWVRVYDYGTVEPSIGDGGFNICVTHQDINIDGADLVSNITDVSNNNPDAGDTITIDFTVTNIGDEATKYWFAPSVYFSANKTLSDSDAFLSSIPIYQTIAPNETVNLSANLTIPNVNDGQYYLAINPDPTGIVDENNKGNNLDFFPIYVGDVEENGPNLDIKSLDCIPNDNLAPGQMVEIAVEVKNEGNSDSDGFDTAIIFDFGNDGDYDVGIDEIVEIIRFPDLDEGDSDERNRDVYIPTNIPSTGNYRIIAIADFENDIVETDEDDNDKVISIEISTLNPAGPDLVCDFVKWEINETNTQVSSQNLCIDTEYRLYWEITNKGNIDVSGGYQARHDAYISSKPYLDGTAIVFHSRFANAESHYVGKIITAHDNDEWRGISSGQYYLLLVADSSGDVVEIDESNNVTVVPITLNNCNNSPLPDVEISIDSYTPYSSQLGDIITVGLLVSNTGDAPVSDFDIELYLSEDDIFHGYGSTNTLNDHRLFEVVYPQLPETINPSETISLTMSAYTKNSGGLQGDLSQLGLNYLFAVADENGDIRAEYSRDNNIDVVPVEVTSLDCYYHFRNEIFSLPYDEVGFVVLFIVNTEDDCAWTANGMEDWIITPSNYTRIGNGTVLLSLENENPYPFPRTGHINVSGEIFEFVQEARPCELLDGSVSMGLASSNVTDINCVDEGSIELTIQNGFPPYSYSWSNGTTQKDLVGITTTGDYTVMITDISGCIFERTFTIGESYITDITVKNSAGVLISNQTNATYQWLDCTNGLNMPIDGETSHTFTPSTIGDYAIEINYGSCLKISECITISTLSDEIISSELIKIYPNPVSDILTINIGEKQPIVNVEIFNLIGQEINHYEFKNKKILEIKTRDLSQGLYFLKIKTDGNKSKEFKIVKE